MPVQGWVWFLVFDAALCFAPGPAMLYVLASGLRGGRGAALAANFGIVSGNALYVSLLAAGVGRWLLASAGALLLLRLIGAAYLLALGFAIFRGAPARAPPPSSALRHLALRRVLTGVGVQMANPKTFVLYTALLPRFVDTGRALAPQFAVLALTTLIVQFGALWAYGEIAARFGAHALRPGLRRGLQRAAGGLLMTAGVVTAAA
jgi:homoserine/homoserine lactone efflux protein